ncbi:MAG: hypothetical protein QGI63_12320 [Rhodospirillales bacterium]|jgi:hypothetical protein|nr:hypothetical protein [Rhodospirillales bacterium]MDP6775042.1 hypothetical protein [Rhodospirillales bacterium]
MSAGRAANFARAAAFFLTAGVLQACSYPGSNFSLFATTCVADARERVEAADWSKVEVIPLRIRQNEFNPMIIDLKQDRPYVIRITNADDKHHFFGASDFFRSVAVAKVDEGGDRDDRTCISRVSVGGGQTAEVVFVTVRDGRFEFADNLIDLPWLDFGNPMGIIYVQ